MFSAIALTLFPDMFPGPLGHSLAGKALEQGIWSLKTLQIRDFATDKHQKVDDSPYGGGAGMVMKPDVLDAAINEAKRQLPDATLIYFTPRGIPLTQSLVRDLALGIGHLGEKPPAQSPIPNPQSLILLCGRYEGVDQRLLDHHKPLEISLGDFVLSGGEIAALSLLDAAVRLLPGVMGQPDSLTQESFTITENYACLLEYPHYTKPLLWKGLEVPEVLLSGNHAKIEAWRKAESIKATQAFRPDLWEHYQSKTNNKS
jgi:tRNA (guanine37-N1)-methyltransferase